MACLTTIVIPPRTARINVREFAPIWYWKADATLSRLYKTSVGIRWKYTNSNLTYLCWKTELESLCWIVVGPVRSRLYSRRNRYSPLMYINTSLLKCIHTGIMYVPMCVMYANNYLKTIIWGSSRQEWKVPFRPSCCITDQLINRLDRSITKVCQCKKNCMVTFKLFGIIPLFPPKNPP